MNQKKMPQADADKSELDDEREARWHRWRLQLSRIEDDILAMNTNRQIWDYLRDSLTKRKAYLQAQVLARWYVESQSSTVRRMASDGSQDKSSLASLLASFEQYIDEFGGKQHGEEMTAESVAADRKKLKDTSRSVATWASENVAHLGRKKSADPTFDDLGKVIELLGEMLQKYTLILTGEYMADTTPMIGFDWTAPFREPWGNEHQEK